MENVLISLDELDFSQPLSLKTILKRARLNDKRINKRLMLGTLHKSGKYRNVNPLEVGNGKMKLNVWTRI
tara:strand:- start:430 stop:639 length:210 start_codon:yes stop_codon:yes gene_type:complete